VSSSSEQWHSASMRTLNETCLNSRSDWLDSRKVYQSKDVISQSSNQGHLPLTFLRAKHL
jgi:hypothetical protein